MTTPIVPSISDEQLEDINNYCARPIFKDDAHAPVTMGEMRGLIARLRAAEADAKRYRFLADNACDVIMSASMTDYGDGDTTSGPRVEVDPGQYPVETFGSAKLKLDNAIDAAMEPKP